VYTLRLPFRIAEGQRLGKFDESLQGEVEGLHLRLDEMPPYYVLLVQGFESAGKAEAFYSRSLAGLFWAMLSQSLPFIAKDGLRHAHYPDDPKQAGAKIFGPGADFVVEVMLDGSSPAVYPSGLKIAVMTAGELTIEVGISAPKVLSSILEGIQRANLEALEDDRVRIALELFRSHFFERSSEARLITLVMALESLAPSWEKHPVAIELLAGWRTELIEHRDMMVQGSDEYDALVALERELLVRREASLTSQIRTLVRDTLKEVGFSDAEERARRAVQVYDTRSRLVHNGRVDAVELHDALRDAKRLASDVLRARIAVAEGSE
jgi:hypothetical protein